MQKPAQRCRQNSPKRTVPSADGSREALFGEHLHLVNMVVGRIITGLPPHADIDDLYSAGRIGLWSAALRYDPTNGASFYTYARGRIRGAVMDELRRLDPLTRGMRERQEAAEKAAWALRSEGKRPDVYDVAQRLGIPIQDLQVAFVSLQESGGNDASYEELIGDETFPSPDAGTTVDMEIVSEMLREFPSRDQEMITAYFFGGLTLRQIGEKLGITESRVSQIIKNSLAIIRDRFARQDKQRATAS